MSSVDSDTEEGTYQVKSYVQVWTGDGGAPKPRRGQKRVGVNGKNNAVLSDHSDDENGGGNNSDPDDDENRGGDNSDPDNDENRGGDNSDPDDNEQVDENDDERDDRKGNKNGDKKGNQKGDKKGSGKTPSNATSFEQKFFPFNAKDAAAEKWDIIVIGTGIGGGIVAGDLFDSNSRLGKYAKKVLVIEKGGLVFHSHCLNASRPAGLGEDRGQQNDTFFALFKDQFTFSGKTNTKDWSGGAMYNLGGRSAAWGLFAPRIHDTTLRQQFKGIGPALTKTWYPEAEKLMSLSLPKTNTIQQNVMERLNMVSDPQWDCTWQWGRIASEFGTDKNFDFSKGAYSPIDKLLEIAMSKRMKDGKYIEHKNWSIILNTDAREIFWKDTQKSVAAGVVVRDASGAEYKIKLRDSGKIVLAAGSVQSPTILMRSGKTDFLKNNGGLHLTDHDIFAKAYTFQHSSPEQRAAIGAMKIQTYVTLPSSTPDEQKVALCNVSIDASSFLPRETLTNEFFTNEDFSRLIFAFITQIRLNPSNTISLVKNEPVVTVNREIPFKQNDPDIVALRELAIRSKEEMQEALGIQFIDDDDSDDKFFNCLGLGAVAHELGTIPLQGVRGQLFCLNDDLSLVKHQGIYVCDLSLFPYSPEVNPTLTLAALALRLSRNELLPRKIDSPSNPGPNFKPDDPDLLWVMNQTGEKIKIFISNHAGASARGEAVDLILEPGDDITRKRKAGLTECVSVYRLQYGSDDDYLPSPIFYPAKPGELTIIV